MKKKHSLTEPDLRIRKLNEVMESEIPGGKAATMVIHF